MRALKGSVQRPLVVWERVVAAEAGYQWRKVYPVESGCLRGEAYLTEREDQIRKVIHAIGSEMLTEHTVEPYKVYSSTFLHRPSSPCSYLSGTPIGGGQRKARG